MTGAGKFTPKLFIGWFGGLVLAVLAFAQAAASAGLAIDGFRPLGAGFFSWRVEQMQLSIDVFESRDRADAKRAIVVGQSTLRLAPLNPRSLWLIGIGRELKGDLPGARRAMEQAERVSRRDGAVELWLGVDNFRREAVKAGLRNFDLMLRGDRNAATTVMPRLSMIILAPEGRRHLAPYIREDNPWLLDLLQAAVSSLPRAEPLAALLIDRGKKAPDIASVRPIYATLMKRLIREREYRQALRLHPLLPGSIAESLRDIGVAGDGTSESGYPPFIWDFSDSSERGGVLVGVGREAGLDIFGSPGTIGIAASKLVEPLGRGAFGWRVDDRTVNFQSEAVWEATCLIGESAGTVRRSVNLLGDGVPLGRTMMMRLPEDCRLLRMEMRIAGGVGRTPATITVSSLKLSSAERK